MADAIYPIPFFDCSSQIKPLVVSWTLRFDSVLNGERLCSALDDLIQNHSDWRKLGSRLRTNPSSLQKLEYHVPAHFTPERPSLSYSSEAFQTSITEHPVAKRLPAQHAEPCLQAGPLEFRCFSARPDAPSSLLDFVDRDVPLLSLHVVTFTDATLVSVIWPHILMDGMGFRDLVKAWSHVLHGRGEKVATLVHARDDVLYEIAGKEQQSGRPERERRVGEDGGSGGGARWVMQDRMLTGVWFVLFILRALWDIAVVPRVQNRTIFLPKKALDALYHEALEDLTDDPAYCADDADVEKMVPSKGDVLVAWLCQIVSGASQTGHRSITAVSAVDVRDRLSDLKTRSDEVFLQNVVIVSGTSWSKKQLHGSLGHLARDNRRELLLQTRESNIKGFFRESRRQWDSQKVVRIIYGQARDLMFLMSNRSKADVLNAADFGPAVLTESQDTPKKHGSGAAVRPGIPIYQHSQVMKMSWSWRNVVIVNGRDHCDDYWLTAIFTEKVWKAIDTELKRLAKTM